MKPAEIQNKILSAKKLRATFNVDKNLDTLSEFFYSIGFKDSSRYDYRWEGNSVDVFLQNEVLVLDFGLNPMESNEIVTLNVSLASNLTIGDVEIRKLSLSAGGIVENPVLKPLGYR